MRSWSALLAAALLSSSCSPHKPASASAPGRVPPKPPRVARDTVTVRDPELEKRVARLELRLLERDAQVEDLQERLEDARAEVVRAMAKLRTATSRAEAASGAAEAEVALQSLRSSAAPQAPEVAQVTRLVRQSAEEFDKQNYGGALYLANQAKALASSYHRSVGDGSRSGSRPGESAFALPIRLKVASRGNIREGPGTGFAVAFAVEPGTVLTGVSYLDDWIHVSDDTGRAGWIFRTLIARP